MSGSYPGDVENLPDDACEHCGATARCRCDELFREDSHLLLITDRIYGPEDPITPLVLETIRELVPSCEDEWLTWALGKDGNTRVYIAGPVWYSVELRHDGRIMTDGFEVEFRPPAGERLETVMRRRGYTWDAYKILSAILVTW